MKLFLAVILLSGFAGTAQASLKCAFGKVTYSKLHEDAKAPDSTIDISNPNAKETVFFDICDFADQCTHVPFNHVGGSTNRVGGVLTGKYVSAKGDSCNLHEDNGKLVLTYDGESSLAGNYACEVPKK